MKVCSRCKIEKDESEFGKDNHFKDKLSIYCKICMSKKNKRWSKENPEKKKESNRKGAKKYLQRHPEKIIEARKRSKEWSRQHPDSIRESGRKYDRNHPEKSIEYRHTPMGAYVSYRSCSKQKNRKFNLTFEEFMSFWQKDCKYCGEKIETVGLDRIDNNIGYEIDNIVPCCTWCNKMKLNFSTQKFIEHCNKIVNKYYA